MIAIDIISDEQLQLGGAETALASGLAPNVIPTSPARCADGHGTLTHLFFSDDLVDIARAKAICAKCPIAELCLEGALERAEPWGVWGGQLLDNGRVVAHKRPRGRPATHPRPIQFVDEDRQLREVHSVGELDPRDVVVRVA